MQSFKIHWTARLEGKTIAGGDFVVQAHGEEFAHDAAWDHLAEQKGEIELTVKRSFANLDQDYLIGQIALMTDCDRADLIALLQK